MNVQNALAATAAAWAAGAHLHDIRQGLRTFTTSYFMAPGRLNMFELDGYRVVVDYAHNPPAMRGARRVRRAPHRADRRAAPGPSVTGRRIGVIATAGDRRDEDIRELGRWRRATSTRSSSARTRTTAAGRAATPPRSSPRASSPPARSVASGRSRTVLDELEATRRGARRRARGRRRGRVRRPRQPGLEGAPAPPARRRERDRRPARGGRRRRRRTTRSTSTC